MDNIKTTNHFIDLANYYHLQKCSMNDYLNCRFIDRLTQIYILFYPNSNEEDGLALVFEFQKYFLKGCFHKT